MQASVESRAIDKLGTLAEELQLSGFVQPDQAFKNEAPVQAGQNPDGEEEIPAAGDPTGAIDRQATARHDHVDMRVVRHRRTPGVKHGCDTDPGAEVLWIGCDPDHRVRARPHQQIVDLPLVLMRDIRDGLG